MHITIHLYGMVTTLVPLLCPYLLSSNNKLTLGYFPVHLLIYKSCYQVLVFSSEPLFSPHASYLTRVRDLLGGLPNGILYSENGK